MPINWTTTDKAGVDNGIKILVYSPAGYGKTTLCATAPDPIILSAESGLLSIRNHSIPVMQINTIQDLEDAYQWLLNAPDAKRFKTVCLDSISEIAEQVLNNAKATVKDPRQAYGELIEKMEGYVRKFRDLKGFHVYMAGKMEPFKDELTGTTKYIVKMPGSKLGPAMPYFFDEVFALSIGKDPATQKEFRYLRTQPDFQFEAKDRSGSLDLMEPPNLTHIINKIQGVQ